jgi:hypothetical protein
MFKLIKIQKRDIAKIMQKCYYSSIGRSSVFVRPNDGRDILKPKIEIRTFFNGIFKTQVQKIYEHRVHTAYIEETHTGLTHGNTYYLYFFTPINQSLNADTLFCPNKDETCRISPFIKIPYKQMTWNDRTTDNFYFRAQIDIFYGMEYAGYFLMNETQYANIRKFICNNDDQDECQEKSIEQWVSSPLYKYYEGIHKFGMSSVSYDKHGYGAMWESIMKKSHVVTSMFYTIVYAFTQKNAKRLPVQIRLNGRYHFVWHNGVKTLWLMVLWLVKANYDERFRTSTDLLKVLRKPDAEQVMLADLRQYYVEDEQFIKNLDEFVAL